MNVKLFWVAFQWSHDILWSGNQISHVNTIISHSITKYPKSGVDLWFLACTIILQIKMQTYIPFHYNKLVSIKYRAIGPTNMPKCVELLAKVQGLLLAIFYFWYLLPCVRTRSIGSYEALLLPSSTFDIFFHVYGLDPWAAVKQGPTCQKCKVCSCHPQLFMFSSMCIN
jgi:hypothetical protein